MLDRQISLYKVDTDAFLNEEERAHKSQVQRLQRFRNHLDRYSSGYLYKDWADEQIKELKTAYKKWLLEETASCVAYNDTHPNELHIRNLDDSYIHRKDGTINITNVVSMFESTLSRSFNIAINELTTDIIILEIYYYDIAKDLIINGFNYNGEHYVYFSSSAGQIRTKKAVFVNESKYEQVKLKLMCGLTVEHINELGGMNINKFLAYKALCNSATDLWEDVLGVPFDIDRCIVVDDFENVITAQFDYIDYQTYEIQPNHMMDVAIPVMDGAGMILPQLSNKNFMVRLPFIKGLLGVFDFKKFVQVNNCSPIVKDLWGKEYDIIEDDIQVIFTKSQLKMYKYYSSWDDYKEKFKANECEAGICNYEEDRIPQAHINYQMLQTLHDMTDREIDKLCRVPNKKIKSITDSVENALGFFGITNDREPKSWFQKSLSIYPELLTDPAIKNDLRDLKNSRVKQYRGGHLDVEGKFTFVIPDLYGVCEWLFQGTTSPKGLLEQPEVYCRLYPTAKELDCLRSPHLYIEHCIRKNTVGKKYRGQYLDDWFCTDAIYTSSFDWISKVLQFDVDGDRLLVIAQKDIIEIAKRNVDGVNPLIYEMKKANAEQLTPQNMWHGLELAFLGGRIGGISNSITKIWNTEDISQQAKDAVRWLCMETNFTIDYAKTLFKPTRPKDVDFILKQYDRAKVPSFFMYAKNKDEQQCEQPNNSMMNRIMYAINDNRLMFKPIKNLGQVDYRVMLPQHCNSYTNDEINKLYNKCNEEYGNMLNLQEDDFYHGTNLPAIRMQLLDKMRQVVNDDEKILTSLVIHLYSKESVRKKKLLWFMFGEQLYRNIETNVREYNQICLGCGKRTDEGLVRNRCLCCRSTEIKNLNGKKLIRCAGCGKDLIIESKSRTKYCNDCKKMNKSNINKIYYSKMQ